MQSYACVSCLVFVISDYKNVCILFYAHKNFIGKNKSISRCVKTGYGYMHLKSTLFH